jgi:hypothetical protein
MAENYDQLVERLISLVAPGFGGKTRPDLVEQVSHLTREIERAGAQAPFIRDTNVEIRKWVDIACSVRRHQEWGLAKVEASALQAAEALRGHAPPPQ